MTEFIQVLDSSNELFSLAADMVNHSGQNIFITGKAGTGKTTFLKYINEDGIIQGTVFLKKSDDKMYLGMLSVSPLFQSQGIGKELIADAEAYACKCGCNAVFMKVISIRYELIAWYERKGYQKTGEREAFPPGNHFGTPTQPLEFLLMEKMIG